MKLTPSYRCDLDRVADLLKSADQASGGLVGIGAAEVGGAAMQAQRLISTAQALMAGARGLLAMDESTGTCNKRFAELIPSRRLQSRRAARRL